jgi:hypothetical protein
MNKLTEAFGEIAMLSWAAEQKFLSTIQRKQVAKKELIISIHTVYASLIN